MLALKRDPMSDTCHLHSYFMSQSKTYGHIQLQRERRNAIPLSAWEEGKLNVLNSSGDYTDMLNLRYPADGWKG